jgi:small-conductance mechanosensitive channel
MNNSIGQDWLIWVGIVAFGFPLLVIILEEITNIFQRRGKPLAGTIRLIKNLVLPTLMCKILVSNILQFDHSNSLVRLVETAFWITVIYASISLVNSILFEEAEANTWRARMPKLLIDLSRLFLILIGTAIVLANVWGADLAGLATALGVSSIVLGLALQDTLGSIMSGIALLFERPFAVGDWLKVGEIEGEVIDINWRSVRLLTKERKMYIVPHLIIGKEIICNYSQPEKYYRENMAISFSYDTPPNLVKQVLKSAAITTQGILKEPSPEIHTVSYGETLINYEVEFSVLDFSQLEEIRDQFMTRIWYVAKRNKLNLHHHDYEYNVAPTISEDSVSGKLAQNLHGIPGFMSLATKGENLDEIAQGTVFHFFGAGEKVIRQDEINKALFIILVGKAALSFINELGQEVEVMILSTGEIFGSMALYRGELSPISVTAVDDLEVIVLYPDAVSLMVERQPSLAHKISQVIERQIKAVSAAKKERKSA